MDHQRVAVVDFDNALSGYDHWRGPAVLGPIIPYAREALLEMREWGWLVVVFTTRGDLNSVRSWLEEHDLSWCRVNSTEHNPPGCSHKPIADVYFDDRSCHCVGETPFNWHKAMRLVRKRYQPSCCTFVDDAAAWSSLLERWFRAPLKRREFARSLTACLDSRSRIAMTKADTQPVS